MKATRMIRRRLFIGALVIAISVGAVAYSMAPRATAQSSLDAYARFKDGPINVDAGNFGTTAKKTIATLTVPAGLYVIFAKGYAAVQPYNAASLVSCRLQAGADFDRAKVGVDGRDHLQTEQQSFALNVLHHFKAGGTIELVCAINGSGVDFHFIKITALTVQSYSNQP